MYHQRFKTTEQCFWEKVDKSGECWLWVAGKNSKGRASFRGKSAPRIAYQMRYGAIPPEIYVCHHCDNPACVNTDHMFLGTQTDNMRDMVLKGRANKPRGETHHKAKLTRHQVDLIRGLRGVGCTYLVIANLFGIGTTQAGRIVNGAHWRHV